MCPQRLKVSATPVELVSDESTILGKVSSILIDVLNDVDYIISILIESDESPVQGPDVSSDSGWYIKAHPNNAGICYFSLFEQSIDDRGFPLSAGDCMYIAVSNLNLLQFFSTAISDKLVLIKC